MSRNPDLRPGDKVIVSMVVPWDDDVSLDDSAGCVIMRNVNGEPIPVLLPEGAMVTRVPRP